MTVDEIYLNIGQVIFNTIDESNWTNAKLNTEIVGDGVVGYTGDYQMDTKTVDLSIRKIPRDISTWLKGLHSITTAGGSNRWNRAVFTLQPQGKFDMEFIWDQELEDEIGRLAK
jgi:hypothetical protein